MTRPDLSDPEFEPTDEQLRELSHAAFLHLGQARRDSDARLREEISVLRAEALLRLRRDQPGKP